MKKISTAKEMQAADAYAIKNCGIPYKKNYGLAMAPIIIKNTPVPWRPKRKGPGLIKGAGPSNPKPERRPVAL